VGGAVGAVGPTHEVAGMIRPLRRVAMRGAILRALRVVIRRVEIAGSYAATPEDARWAARLHTRLTDAFTEALAAPGSAASLAASDARRYLVNKNPTRRESP